MSINTTIGADTHIQDENQTQGQMRDGADGADPGRLQRTRPQRAAADTGASTSESESGVANGNAEQPITASTPILKAASLKMQLTGEQQRELEDCLRVLHNADSTPVDRGYALLNIIEHRLMPSRPDVVEDSWQLFHLSQPDVHEFVKLARKHRAQNGKNPSLAGGVARVAPRSTSTGRSGSPSPSSNLEDGGPDTEQRAVPVEKQAPVLVESKTRAVAAPRAEGAQRAGDEAALAPLVAPEKKPSRKRTPKAAVATAPQGGAAAHNLTATPVEATMLNRAEPALATSMPVEQTAQMDTSLLVAEPETMPAKCVAETPTHTAEGGEPPATRSAERLPYLESILEKGFVAVFEVGAALEEIRDHKLFRTQFKTFGEYFENKWGWTRTRCYQLIAASQVRRNLSTRVDITHLSEPHCRVLSKLPAGDQIAAWTDAAKGASDGKVTPVQLKKAVATLRPPPSAQPLLSGGAEEASESNLETVEVTADPTLHAPPLAEPTASSCAQSAPDTAPVPDGPPEFNLDEEWLPVEASLHRLFQRCPPDQWAGFWLKLTQFFEQHPELIPAEERNQGE